MGLMDLVKKAFLGATDEENRKSARKFEVIAEKEECKIRCRQNSMC